MIVRHSFLFPYFFVWAQKPEPIHFVAPMEHERNAYKEFLESLKNCCQGRVIGGFEVDVRLKAGETRSPRLWPPCSNGDKESEEDFLTSKLSSSRTNLLESIKPMSGYQKVSPAEMAKSLTKRGDFNASLTSDLEPLEKKKQEFWERISALK
ncbi:unnamed protein product, partial [Mesorhabditis belari]|uniref:Uncharacterized protein n=1 Tax=Mesorhabditis belari TaxID=2138241 RepID=A0AAF3J6Y5_9BILA